MRRGWSAGSAPICKRAGRRSHAESLNAQFRDAGARRKDPLVMRASGSYPREEGSAGTVRQVSLKV
jgi:hypothetical protein